MATGRRLEDQLRAAEALRQAPMGQATVAGIVAALRHGHGLVVAAGAKAAAVHRLEDQAPALLAALDRLYHDPVKHDPQCQGKLAVVAALDDLGCAESAALPRAIAYVQQEPVWGGQVDSAGPLRIRAAQALVRLGHHGLYRILGDLLVDPLPTVRGAASQLLGAIGGERAALLLRLRLAVGEHADAADAMADHAAALLACDGAGSVAMVAALLDHDDRAVAGGAALALGGSRLPEALEPLLDGMDRIRDRQLLRLRIDAIGLLRSEAAAMALLTMLSQATGETATACVRALRLYRDRATIAERVEAVIRERGQSGLADAWS